MLPASGFHYSAHIGMIDLEGRDFCQAVNFFSFVLVSHLTLLADVWPSRHLWSFYLVFCEPLIPFRWDYGGICHPSRWTEGVGRVLRLWFWSQFYSGFSFDGHPNIQLDLNVPAVQMFFVVVEFVDMRGFISEYVFSNPVVVHNMMQIECFKLEAKLRLTFFPVWPILYLISPPACKKALMAVVLSLKMQVFDKWRLNRREQVNGVCNEGTNYIAEVLECVQHKSVRAAEGYIYFKCAGWSCSYANLNGGHKSSLCVWSQRMNLINGVSVGRVASFFAFAVSRVSLLTCWND